MREIGDRKHHILSEEKKQKSGKNRPSNKAVKGAVDNQLHPGKNDVQIENPTDSQPPDPPYPGQDGPRLSKNIGQAGR